mmetsp:Transcript_18110/g.37845  ORF Transcript_18110/g.37845 Transcript_18110/m.37845 type:complete len:404 (+) Transcript_18110:602-1813(+)
MSCSTRHVSTTNHFLGIQPNVERLARKHKEQCDEIESKTKFSKQKLELQCENDLSERVQAFQRSEQQSNTCFSQRNNFANMLLREKNEHAMSLMKLKEKFMQDEESTKELYSLQLETLAKDHDVALSKIRRSKNTQQLTRQLLAEKDARRQELESRLELIGKEVNSSKAKWEASWIEASALRIERENKQKMDDLLDWRTMEINNLIKRSIRDESIGTSAGDEEGEVADVSHEENVAALEERLKRQHDRNKITSEKISSITSRKSRESGRIDEVERDLRDIEDKISDITNMMDQKKRQQEEIVSEAHDRIEDSLQSISLRKDTIEKEIESIKSEHKKESNDHNANRDKAIQEHGTKLDKLESYATESAHEIDRKLHTVHKLIKEQSSYLSRAQNLLNTRYKNTN